MNKITIDAPAGWHSCALSTAEKYLAEGAGPAPKQYSIHPYRTYFPSHEVEVRGDADHLHVRVWPTYPDKSASAC